MLYSKPFDSNCRFVIPNELLINVTCLNKFFMNSILFSSGLNNNKDFNTSKKYQLIGNIFQEVKNELLFNIIDNIYLGNYQSHKNFKGSIINLSDYEYENNNEDKFVDLTKSYNMRCIYNRKFKKWEPTNSACGRCFKEAAPL